MKNPIEWISEINGKSYEFSYQRVKGITVLTVNGEPIEIKAGIMSSILGFDEAFMLDGMEARLVIQKKKPDIVLNGTFLQSGKAYVQRPAWVMVFFVICILIPIVSLGGALPALFGLGGAGLCVSVSKTSLSVFIKVILCIGISLLAWFLWFLLIFGIAAL